MPKNSEKEKAIELRKRGLSYREILCTVKVAKSTLSLWLRSVGLSKKQKQRLTKKKIESAIRGARRKREQRLEITRHIKEKAAKEINTISRKELWLMGVMLYWAEGSKEKERSSQVEFSNNDPRMLRLFIRWLLEILKVEKADLKFEIYIHENHKNRLEFVREYWAQTILFPLTDFQTIRFKKHKIKTTRKNIGNDYNGLLKVKVRESSGYNRQIAGWVEGVDRYYCRLV